MSLGKRLRRLLIRGGILLIIAYLVYASALFVVQRHVLFPRWLTSNPVSADVTSIGGQQYWVTVVGGQVEAWYLPPRAVDPTGRSPALLFMHGNAELIDEWAHRFSLLRERGLGVMLVEYPGYGRSTGKPSQNTLTQVVVAAYDSLAARDDIDAARIAAFGRSVGGGAACALLRKRPVAALILQSTFTSTSALVGRFLVPRFLVRDRFENLEAVRDYPGPVLVAHGRFDDTIPFEHGVALAEAADVGLLVTYDCAHDDCPPVWSSFLNTVLRFLEDHGVVAAESVPLASK